MLDKLLESKQTRERASGSAILSITAHTALIAAAVYATAQARVQPTRLSYVVPTDYFPRISHATQSTQITTPRPKRIDGQRPIYVEPALEIKILPLDVTGVLSKPSDFGATRISSGGSTSTSDSASGLSGGPLSAEQVEKQVAVIGGNGCAGRLASHAIHSRRSWRQESQTAGQNTVCVYSRALVGKL